MTAHLVIDKNTDVAFIDVTEAAENAVIRVMSVSDLLGLKSEITARFDAQNGTLLGLTIEDYSAFRREITMKYMAFRIGKIIDLLICSVKASLLQGSQKSHELALTS